MDKLEIHNRPYNLQFTGAKIDILVPFYKQFDKVIKLVESILRLTKSVNYKLTLIDDGSNNNWFNESLKKYPKTNVLINKHSGFGSALNLGFKNTSNPWVAIVHSDCEIVESGWLLEMGRSLLNLNKSNVKLVSARTNNPGDGYDENLKGNSGEYIEDFILKEGSLPLYCALARRELFNKIGFIKPYPLALYEDMELGHRMEKSGFKQAICGKSFIFHHGGSTITEICKNNLKNKKIMEENFDRYVKDIGEIV